MFVAFFSKNHFFLGHVPSVALIVFGPCLLFGAITLSKQGFQCSSLIQLNLLLELRLKMLIMGQVPPCLEGEPLLGGGILNLRMNN